MDKSHIGALTYAVQFLNNEARTRHALLKVYAFEADYALNALRVDIEERNKRRINPQRRKTDRRQAERRA